MSTASHWAKHPIKTGVHTLIFCCVQGTHHLIRARMQLKGSGQLSRPQANTWDAAYSQYFSYDSRAVKECTLIAEVDLRTKMLSTVGLVACYCPHHAAQRQVDICSVAPLYRAQYTFATRAACMLSTLHVTAGVQRSTCKPGILGV
jgi:hypothetical protein